MPNAIAFDREVAIGRIEDRHEAALPNEFDECRAIEIEQWPEDELSAAADAGQATGQPVGHVAGTRHGVLHFL